MPDAPVDFRLLAGAGAPARDFKAGEVIFREGDPAHELFIIQSGEIEIRLGNRVLETLPQYAFSAKIDSSPRSATAVTVTDTKLVSVSEKQFLFLVSSRRISRSTSCASWRAARARRTGLSSRRPPRFPLTDTARERKRIARCPSL